ncbi:efflux RND transporter periplasmic adaptor subunit [Patescibacteria group bacterium]|nr:efflux RND transporter periplasmic adaptor subunit [Patescibacteria group bacterium]
MKARFWIIGIAVLVVIPTIVFGVWKPFAKAPVYDLYSVTRGEVTSTISVTGSVVNGQSLELGFLSPGIVKTVAVEIGSEVKKGDLLVALNTDILNRQAAQARASIQAAQAMVTKAQNQLRSVDVNVLNFGLNNARVALENAQRSYQNALNAYNAGQGLISGSAEVARVSLNNAQAAFTNAQSSYNRVLSDYNVGQATLAMVQQASAALTSASAAYEMAQAQYQTALRQSDAERVNSRAQLDSARAALNSAEAAYRLAEAQRSQSLAPASSADIQSASAQVAASVAALQIVQAQMAQAVLKAPIDGRVVTVNAKPAELSPIGQPVVVLETAGEFKIEANISETELSKVRVGQTVRIAFDALPNVAVEGSLATIDPAATIILGVVSYKATIVMNQPIADLFSSLTADLEIITDNRSDVIVVPRRTLTKTDGVYHVKVLQNKQVVEKEVEIGLMGDTDAEIVSGLAENEQVILKQS